MQVVIEIPERCYKLIKKSIFTIVYDEVTTEDEKKLVTAKFHVMVAIKNGIVLPKGHGKIGDLDKLLAAMKERNEDNGGEPLNAVDKGYDLAYQHLVKEVEQVKIIEADKEREE